MRGRQWPPSQRFEDARLTSHTLAASAWLTRTVSDSSAGNLLVGMFAH